MPDDKTCRGYGLIAGSPDYMDCINYRGKYRNGNRPVTGIQKRSAGGYLVGSSHEEGGIPAIVDGVEPIELEGGEFVINKQTVDAVGENFLHKLNSTQTTHHQGGFQQGQLPNPSKFNRGGGVRQNKSLQTGGRAMTPRKRIPAQRLRESKDECPRGMYRENGACFPIGGNANKTSPTTGVTAPMLRKGGTVKQSKRKLQEGGPITQQLPSNVRTKPVIKQRMNKSVNKPTSKSIGNKVHSHKLNVDVHGDGWTSYEMGHEHKVKNNEVQVACPPDIQCHQH